MTNEELIKLQKEQYSILKDVAEICKKNHIDYYLVYGTLLGAVRHKGSIPWDNDIDICMNRKNFQKLLEAIEQLPEKYEYGEVGVSGTYATGLMRVYKKGSLIYTNEHGKDGAHGIHIDIFILEHARNYSKLGRKIVTAWIRYLSIAKLNSYEKKWLYELWKGNTLKKIICKSGDFLRLFFSEKTMEKWMHKLLVNDTCNMNSKEAKYIILADLDKMYPVEYFQKGQYLQYEDSLFQVPDQYVELLEMWYGDYMQLPPENERFTNAMDRFIIEFGE